MRQVLGTVSLVVLLVTLGIHVAALGGRTLQVPPAVGVVLLLAEFVLLGCFVVSAGRHFLRRRPSVAALRDLFPGWVLPLVLVTSMYSFGSFLLGAASGERAVEDGDRRVLMAGGVEVRELDAAEYRAWRAAGTRIDTAYSLVFLLVPCLWFLARREADD